MLTPGAPLPRQQSIQRTNECARFTQVVCEPVPISYQQARWMAGQMAPNDVTSCFNKTLEGRAASLSSNKDYYAIYFLSSLSNLPSLSVIFYLTPSPQTSQRLRLFVLSMDTFLHTFVFVFVCVCVQYVCVFVCVCVCWHARIPEWCYPNSWIWALPLFNKWDSKRPRCDRASPPVGLIDI